MKLCLKEISGSIKMIYGGTMSSCIRKSTGGNLPTLAFDSLGRNDRPNCVFDKSNTARLGTMDYGAHMNTYT